MKYQIKLVILGILISVSGMGAERKQISAACKSIKEACEKAGFVEGGYKEGKGLWVNCFQPILQGKIHPDAKLSLPSVDSKQVEACKKAQPKAGKKKSAK